VENDSATDESISAAIASCRIVISYFECIFVIILFLLDCSME